MTLPCKDGIAMVSTKLLQLHQRSFEVGGSAIVPHADNAYLTEVRVPKSNFGHVGLNPRSILLSSAIPEPVDLK